MAWVFVQKVTTLDVDDWLPDASSRMCVELMRVAQTAT